jgi:hypothetical protein
MKLIYKALLLATAAAALILLATQIWLGAVVFGAFVSRLGAIG